MADNTNTGLYTEMDMVLTKSHQTLNEVPTWYRVLTRHLSSRAKRELPLDKENAVSKISVSLWSIVIHSQVV